MATQKINTASLEELAQQISLWERAGKSLVYFVWKEVSIYQTYLFFKYEKDKLRFPEALKMGIKHHYCLIWQTMIHKYPGSRVIVDAEIYKANYAANEHFVAYLLKEDLETVISNAYYGYMGTYENIDLFYFLFTSIQKKEPFKNLSERNKAHFINDHLSFIQAFEKYFERGYGDDISID